MKKMMKIIICVLVIILSLTTSYIILAKHHNEHQYDINKIEARKCYEPNLVLEAAIERKNWNGLALSENFRNKFKTRENIIPNISKYTSFSAGYSDLDGKRCIVIPADVADTIFDFWGGNKVTTLFYFDYVLNANNEIDDVVLLKTSQINSMTGREIAE